MERAEIEWGVAELIQGTVEHGIEKTPKRRDTSKKSTKLQRKKKRKQQRKARKKAA